jgi:hypothetical protein
MIRLALLAPLALAACATVPVKQEPLPSAEIVAAVRWIEARTEYRWEGEALPHAIITTEADIDRADGHRKGSVAIFQHTPNRIMMTERATGPRKMALLVHEVAHWFQHISQGFGCEGVDEYEAASLQQQYLWDHGMELVRGDWQRIVAERDACLEG